MKLMQLTIAVRVEDEEEAKHMLRAACDTIRENTLEDYQDEVIYRAWVTDSGLVERV